MIDNLEATKIVIPIRALSQLYRTEAVRWIAIVRDLERAEGPMRAYYAPLVNAILAEFKNSGSGQAVMDKGHADFGPYPTSLVVIEKSQKAFDHFVNDWRTLFSAVEPFPEKAGGYRYVEFAGHLLRGGFHAKAVDKRGKPVLLYFHASIWSPEMLKAHAELLGVIAEERHGLPRNAVRILDFNEKSILKLTWPPLRLREQLKKHCELYEMLFSQAA